MRGRWAGVAQKSKHVLSSAVFMVTLGGCAIHPLPEDWSGSDTFQIVQRIRCEARTAVKERAIRLLAESQTASAEDKARWTEFLDKNAEKWEKIPFARFGERTVALVSKYDGTLIGYDFQFTMSEENNVSGGINFLASSGGGINRLGFAANNNRARKNIRNFRIQDSFGQLLKDNLTCSGVPRGKDYLYPITGEIGLAEVIETFLDLNEVQNLNAREKVPLFGDTLEFTTQFVASASPRIVLSPIGRALSLADAGVTAEAKRTDVHQVLVALSVPAEVASTTRPRPTLAPRTILRRTRGAAQRRGSRSEELNEFIDFQIQRNTLTTLGATRP